MRLYTWNLTAAILLALRLVCGVHLKSFQGVEVEANDVLVHKVEQHE
jgi:hypothetical protein